jgi:prepilin signal peptidase PulO-like enzyme (type II secretory pathway)
MDLAAMLSAGLPGAVAGWMFPQFQHDLYTEPEFREQPATGRTLLLLRLFCAISACAGLALAFRPDHYDVGPAALSAAFLLLLVALSSTDFERRRIPNKLTYPAAVLAIVVCWAWPDRSVGDIALGGLVAVGVAALLVGLGAVVGGPGLALGIGDGKLIIVLGLILGWPGIMPALFYGIAGAGVVAVVLMVRKGRRATFSYGPYLAAGGAIVLLFPSVA